MRTHLTLGLDGLGWVELAAARYVHSTVPPPRHVVGPGQVQPHRQRGKLQGGASSGKQQRRVPTTPLVHLAHCTVKKEGTASQTGQGASFQGGKIQANRQAGQRHEWRYLPISVSCQTAQRPRRNAPPLSSDAHSAQEMFRQAYSKRVVIETIA